MSVILLGYFTFFAPEPVPQEAQNTPTQQVTDSTAQAQTAPAAPTETPDPIASLPDSLQDAIAFDRYGQLAAGAKGEAQEVVLENEDLRLRLSSHGARILSVELKNYKTHDKQPLILMDETSHNMAWTVQTPKGPQDLQKLYFNEVRESGTRSVTFALNLPNGKSVTRHYNLPETGFTVDHKLDLGGLQLSQPQVGITWTDRLKRVDFDLEQSRLRATVNYYNAEEGFDQLSESPTSGDEAALEMPVDWVSFKQRFFSAALLTEKGLQRVNVKSEIPAETDSTVIKTLHMQAEVQAADLANHNFRYFFGPNDYNTCDAVAEGFSRNVYLGWAIVLPITRFLVIPLFDFMEDYISSYGIIIILMVLLIKLALSPLTYKAYVSQAKMKVLQPEMKEIKEKYKDDQMAASQAQMQLFSKVGASPLSGCLPMLLQMPFFLALFTFFPNAIQLRGESFLWATDLSTYDSIWDLPMNIPFYGDHVSLFTLLMAASQLIYGHFSMQGNPSMTGTQNGVNMKMIQYMMPVMFLFFLNSYPAGLTMYYFVSNLITIGQTLIIREVFVDEKKVRAKLDETKKRRESGEEKKSGFRKRLEDGLKQAQEQQRAQQEQRKKKPKKKK